MTEVGGSVPLARSTGYAGDREDRRVVQTKIREAINLVSVECAEFLQIACDRFGLLDPLNEDVSVKVLWQIYNASQSKMTERHWVELGPEFGFNHLEGKELVQLYQVINEYHHYKEEKSLFRNHLFDIKDQMFRLSIHSEREAAEIFAEVRALHSPLMKPLEGKLEALGAYRGAFQPIFHSLIKKSEAVAGSSWSDYMISKKEVDLPRTKKKLKVAKVSLETTRNRVGGLGAVLSASAEAHRALGAETIRGIHAFYSHDKEKIPADFKGVVLHEFNGEMVESSVYKDAVSHEYLVQPPSKYRSLFDVNSASTLYSSHEHTSIRERSLYLASASAAIISLYSGKDGSKAIDVVQGDGHHVAGPLFELMATRTDHMVKDAGLWRSSRVALTHMLVPSTEEQGDMPTSEFARIGSNVSGYGSRVNATASALIHADARVFVSKGVRQDALDIEESKNAGLRSALLTKGKETVFRGEADVHGITNGIDTSIFDITNPAQFGEFTPKKHVVALGGAGAPVAGGEVGETLDLVGNQDRIKALLAGQGLIADASKPLFLFVGRYSSEKGINMLPSMVESVLAQGGQCVIMGVKCEDKSALAVIQQLKLRSGQEGGESLKVYDELSDQRNTFAIDGRDTGVKKGWLLRAAASVVLVPSHAEACGLVPMEAHCTGALIVAPNHQGLRDMCIPLPHEGAPDARGPFEGGNTFMYEHHDSEGEACGAITRAMQFMQSVSKEDLNRYMQDTHDYAVTTYGWLNLDADKQPISGAAVNYSQVYHDVYHRLHPDRSSQVETYTEILKRLKLTRDLEAAQGSFKEPGSQASLAAEGSSEREVVATDSFAGARAVIKWDDPAVEASYRSMISRAREVPLSEDLSRDQIETNIQTLYIKVYNLATLSSAEADTPPSVFAEMQQRLQEVVGLICSEPSLITDISRDLAFIQVALSGELCLVGILDNLRSCQRLLTQERAPTIDGFVQHAYREFKELTFDRLYTLFLNDRPDSSHARVAFRMLFDGVDAGQATPEIAALDVADGYLDASAFPEFRDEGQKSALIDWVRDRWDVAPFLPLLAGLIAHNDERRDQLIDWFKAHVPTGYMPTFSEEEQLEFEAADLATRKGMVTYQYLCDHVYDMETYAVKDEALAQMLKAVLQLGETL